MSWLDRINPQIHVVGSHRQQQPWRDSRRALHDHELMLFDHGFIGSIAWDHGIFHMAGSDWIIIPPGVFHTCRGGGPGAPWRAWIHFDWDYSDGISPKPLLTYAPAAPRPSQLRPAPDWIPIPSMAHGHLDGTTGIRDLHGRLAQAWNSGAPGQRASARGLLLELLARLLAPRTHTAIDARQGLALRIRDILDDIASQPFAGSDALRTRLADLGHTADHCARAFRVVFGLTPTRYLAAQRMRQAEELLTAGNKPADVARHLGFTDAGYFNRMFRHHVGRAPGRWKQERLAPPAGI